MFKKHYNKRSSNPLFVIFRLILSLLMFAVLLAGLYTAYKHFSGLDPLKLNPQKFLALLSSVKLPSPTPAASVGFKFLLIADSHSDNANLRKALTQAKEKHPDLAFIIGLGDYTNVGTIEELNAAKIELDRSGLRYFLIAGDHDLWDSRDKGNEASANFKEIFGPTFQSFTYDNFKFLLLDNSDNYIGVDDAQQSWIGIEMEKAKKMAGILVFIHEPLFHPSSDRFMGKLKKEIKTQAESLIFQFKSAGVKKVISGDIHYFSEYEEPVTKLSMITIGSLVTERNPQVPRYAIGYVFEDGSVKVEDVEIK